MPAKELQIFLKENLISPGWLRTEKNDCKEMYRENTNKMYNIAVAGTGYVGMSLALLLSQNNSVTAVDIVPKKVELINSVKSPIQDDYIEKYLNEAKDGKRSLNLKATLDDNAYSGVDYVIIAAPTNYDPKQNFFDCSAVESVIETVLERNKGREEQPTIVIKSTIPVGYTDSIKKRYGIKNIIFSPEFLRESKALYDNLYPSRIIIGCNEDMQKEASVFSQLLAEGAEKDPIDILYMGTTEAESVKLFSNTYLALRVAYFNELENEGVKYL